MMREGEVRQTLPDSTNVYYCRSVCESHVFNLVHPHAWNLSLSVSDSALQKAQKYELLDPDVRLMLKVRDGNAAAFQAIVDKYQNRLIGVLDHLVPGKGQDLAQDVFLRVYRARETYVPGAKFSTWLFTITHNVASNAIRKLATKKRSQYSVVTLWRNGSPTTRPDGARQKRFDADSATGPQ